MIIKKIYILLLMISLICFLNACFPNSKENVLIKSEYSDEINQEIFEYFNNNDDDDDLYDCDAVAPIDLWRVNKHYTVVNDYLINIYENLNNNFICGYLNLKAKDILDKIKVDNTKRYLWEGINCYLKKYEYALENNMIEKNLNLIEWYECDEEHIPDRYNDLFLICKVKLLRVKIDDLKNDVQKDSVVFIDDNGKYNNNSLFNNPHMYNRLLLLDNEILNDKLTAAYLVKKINRFSFKYIIIDNNKYICPNTSSLDSAEFLEEEFGLKYKTQLIIDNSEYYYYDWNDIYKYIRS